MGISALSHKLLDSDEAVADGLADSLRLLLTALNHFEEPGGYWHASIAGVVAKLKAWDEKQGGFHMGDLEWAAAARSSIGVGSG